MNIKIKVTICSLGVAIFLFSDTSIYEVPVEDIEYTIESVQGFDRIAVSGSFFPFEPGHPELPAKVFNYLLPYGRRLEGVAIIEEEWRELAGDFYVYPRQRGQAMTEAFDFTEPDLEIYGSERPFPENILVSIHSGNMRGYQIGQVGIVPFKYFPRLGKLYMLKHLVISLETEQSEPGLFPRRQTSLVKDMVERVLSFKIVNRSSLNDAQMRPPFYLEENFEDLTPTEVPSLLGAPVDVLIITTDAQYGAYQDFARYKKLYGYNIEVKTVSWVREHYLGVDDAERVRNFIRDAVENWGVLYVLLGGDVPDVPTRWILLPPMEWEMYRFPTVTDFYFSDLDDDWNYDGDEVFGELEDSLDFSPDAYVGRLPTNEGAEVNDYRGKLDAYLHPGETDIQARALFATSYLDRSSPPDTNDAKEMAERLAGHLPAWFDTCILNEKTCEEFEDSVNTGFGIITAIGHGGVHTFQLSRRTGDYADYFFIDSLTNTNRYSVLWVLSCLNQCYQSNCVTKPWIWNPQGGGIGAVALSHYSDAYVHETFTAEHFDRLFTMPLGASMAESKVPFLSIVYTENWYRNYQFSINLLGDPTLDLWDSIPLLYDSVKVTPDTVYVGYDTVTITAYPSVPFEVVFFKEGELFMRDSTETRVLQSGVQTESSGYLKYTVMSDGYITYIDSLVVEPGQSYCVYQSHTILDTMQSDDGVINPGEDIWLHVTVQNTGGTDAIDVDGQLVCGDGFVTMIRDTASYPDMGPGDSGESYTSYYFVVSDSVPDEYSLDCELVLDYAGETSSDSFQFIVGAPVLVHFTQEYTVVADTVTIVPYVVNHGHCGAEGAYGRINAYSDTVVVVDSVVDFPEINTNTIVSSAPDSFKLYLNYPGSEVRYNFRIYYRDIMVLNQEVILDTPAVIDAIWAWGMKHSVVLEWSKVSDAAGYRVYRSTDYGGPYTFLDNHLESICHFEDLYVSPAQNYYYYVTAVDSFMNEGASSDTVCGRTNPSLATGWPQDVYDYIFSSPNFGDIDTTYPGLEIVVCGRNGNVYAWHYDGTPVKPGDSRLFIVTPPLTSYYHELWSSPALGDVTGNGSLEIVFGCRRDTDNLYIIDNQGDILPGWPKSLPGGIISSAALADIDEDGDLEIFVWTEDSAVVYGFHHDGTGVFAGDSILKDFPSTAYRTPSIGDINCDGALEIVCCGGKESESLYVWDKDGNYLSPFPVFIQSEQHLSCSAILGDVLGDDSLEICFYADSTEGLYLVEADGTVKWFKEIPHITHSVVGGVEASPIIADITGDEHPEILCAYLTGFVVYDSLGNILSGFPDTTHIARSIIAADVDNDNEAEAIVGSSNWRLYGYKSSGQWAPGFPIQFGNRLESTPAAYDIDEDGKLELIVGGNDYKFYVYDLETEWTEWPRFRYDPYNSGTYKGFAPAAPYIAQAEKSANDVTLTWNRVITDSLGNQELMDRYGVYRNTSPSFIPGPLDSIGGVLHPETTYTDQGVLTAGESYYYLVKAVDWAENESKKSNMGYVFHKTIIDNSPTATNRNWVSLPYKSGYTTVSDLVAGLSSSGDPVTKVTNLRNDQLYESYRFVTFPFPHWEGVDFAITSGRSYEMVTKDGAVDPLLVLVGSNEPDSVVHLIGNVAGTNRNWVSIPYNAVYSTVSDITGESFADGDPVTKITNLRDDQLYESYRFVTFPFPHWEGVDFAIISGRGYEFVTKDGVTDTTWNPTEWSNEAGRMLFARGKVSQPDIEMRLGSLTQPDRAPVWLVKENVYELVTGLLDVSVDDLVTVRSEKRISDQDATVYEPSAQRESRRDVGKSSVYREPGISHLVCGYVRLPECEHLVFTGYRPKSPFDVLTENVVGCGITRSDDCYSIWFDVGNFKKPWQDGEEVILIIEALRRGRGYFAVVNFVLERGVDIQELGAIFFSPIPEPVVEERVVRWEGVDNTDVVGYSLYHGSERLNHEVITGHEYVAQRGIHLRPVLRGGYETVYGSGQGSQNTPGTHIPIAYAFNIFPNPFVTQMLIDYAVPRQTVVEMVIYDVGGRRVKRLISDLHKAGYYATVWDGTDDKGTKVSPGVYFIRFKTNIRKITEKIIRVN